MAHRSLFTYNITRPYSFRWFTPVTIISALILTGLLSWLNYAANGFDMVVSSSPNPNATIADVPVLKGLPPLLTGNFKPVCQPASLALNSKFFTTHNGLQYEILAIGKHQIANTRFTETLPALIYSNNVLEDCTINSVFLEVESQDRTANQLIRSPFGILVRTYIFCNVTTLAGTVTVYLMSEYNNNPTTVDSTFYSPNVNTKASLWWGESIIETYWDWLAHDMNKQKTCTQDEDVCKGVIRKAKFVFSRPKNSSIEDILDPRFLKIQWYLIYQRPDASMGTYYMGEDAPLHASDYIREARYPSTWWRPAEKLAKSIWSTVLVDLGQSKPSNILLNDTKLQNFTSDFDQLDQHKVNVKRGPATHPYNPSLNLTGPLGTSPAVINTAYICNVPRRKSPGVLIWLILLADLVFLQVAWKIFKLTADAWVDRKGGESQYCEGCILARREQDEVSVKNHSGSDGSSTAAETDSQSNGLTARTRSLIVAKIRRTNTM